MVELFIMVGLPASGKSTWAKKHADEFNAKIISTDNIREELGDVNDQSKNEYVFRIAHNMIRDYLAAGKNVIFDATNVSRKARKAVLKLVPKDCLVTAVITYCPYIDCVSRNELRMRTVPGEVINRMIKNFQTPALFEGIHRVWLTYPPNFVPRNYIMLYNEHKDMDQENHHHTLNLGDHEIKTTRSVSGYNDSTLEKAALVHDCGKPLCKEYDVEKMEYRYFSHDNVGAYLTLGYSYGTVDPVDISLLVNLHMQPYHWRDNKDVENKFRKLWGEDLYHKVMILHYADKNAH